MHSVLWKESHPEMGDIIEMMYCYFVSPPFFLDVLPLLRRTERIIEHTASKNGCFIITKQYTKQSSLL